jgi:hypothetical protein
MLKRLVAAVDGLDESGVDKSWVAVSGCHCGCRSYQELLASIWISVGSTPKSNQIRSLLLELTFSQTVDNNQPKLKRSLSTKVRQGVFRKFAKPCIELRQTSRGPLRALIRPWLFSRRVC